VLTNKNIFIGIESGANVSKKRTVFQKFMSMIYIKLICSGRKKSGQTGCWFNMFNTMRTPTKTYFIHLRVESFWSMG